MDDEFQYKGVDASFYLNKEVTLWILENNEPKWREGILVGIDDSFYWLKFIRGPNQDKPVGFNKSTVIKIDPGLFSCKKYQKGGQNI